MSESSEYFEIEYLRDIKAKGRGSKKEILVEIKWQNYTDEKNTWEPLENLTLPCAFELLEQLKTYVTSKKKIELAGEALYLLKKRYKEEEEDIKKDMLPELDKKNTEHEANQSINNGLNEKGKVDSADEANTLVGNKGKGDFVIKRKILESSSGILPPRPDVDNQVPKQIPSSRHDEVKKPVQNERPVHSTPPKVVNERGARSQSKPTNSKRSKSKDTKPFFQSLVTKYDDIVVEENTLAVIKLTVDGLGNVTSKETVKVDCEIGKTGTTKELMDLITNKLVIANRVIKDFQEKTRKHNEKLKTK